MASLSTCHLGLWLGWQILLNLVKINCVDLLIKRVDLSQTCCIHWVGVLAELLLDFSTKPTLIIQIKHLPNLL